MKETFWDKIRNFGSKVKAKAQNCWTRLTYWAYENPEKAALAASSALALLVKGFKWIFVNHKRNAQIEEIRELKTEYVYDRSAGHYWHLKRPLTSSEWLKINERRENGESMGEILNNLRVLK